MTTATTTTTTLYPRTGPNSRRVEPGIYQLDDGNYILCTYDERSLQYQGDCYLRAGMGDAYRYSAAPTPQGLVGLGVRTWGTLAEARSAARKRDYRQCREQVPRCDCWPLESRDGQHAPDCPVYGELLS